MLDGEREREREREKERERERERRREAAFGKNICGLGFPRSIFFRRAQDLQQGWRIRPLSLSRVTNNSTYLEEDFGQCPERESAQQGNVTIFGTDASKTTPH